MNARARAIVVAVAGVAAALSAAAGAQTYPTRPLRVIVPFAPGGATDAVARMIAPRLAESLGQQVVVENRPGGAATIGMDAVAKSAPDGHTLGMANLTFSINPLLMKKMPFDSERDLALVSHVSVLPFLLAVHPSVPAKSVKELIALARARPGALNYSSSGQASATQMATELFKLLTKTDMVHVPFQGGGPALVAVLSGEVSVYFGTIPPLLAHMRSGRLRVLGVTTLERDPAVPELPTVAEAGVPGYQAAEWGGIVVRAGTPAAILARLNQEIVRALKSPELAQRFSAVGARAVGSTPEAFAEHIRRERETWARVIAAAGIKIE
ncbi:MAG TPA: tripartite tricarboxylate transporter substrate binding protein [Burkholderiales bacterium]|nr:tripartite tricarboxylate transporter substrate binding protein [Burkholderiales bacterium]